MREKKRRKKGIYRGLLAGGLALCLFGGGFAAVNRYVFAAAHDKPVKLQASWQEPAAAAPQAVGYTKADYKVQVDPMYHASNSNAVSAEEAAEIGARYLWEVFGVDLKGCTLYMYYFMDPSRAIGYWYGDVITEGGDRHKAPYRFGIEAVSGEPESIIRQDFPAEGKETILFKEEKIEGYYRANSDEFNELAKTYARKLLSAEPVKAEFLTTAALLAPGYDYEIPEGGGYDHGTGGKDCRSGCYPGSLGRRNTGFLCLYNDSGYGCGRESGAGGNRPVGQIPGIPVERV